MIENVLVELEKKMEFGICSGPDIADMAREAGFTYLDGSVGDVLKPTGTEAEFEDSYAKLSAAVLPTQNLNCLLPGGLFVAGPDADIPKAVAYCTIAMQRAGRIGIRTICFGSGNGRRCPEGWPMETASKQIRKFVSELAPVVKAAGVKLAVENLRTAETNTLCKIADISKLLDEVASPAVGILIDGYHWKENADSAEDVVKISSKIFHTHIATSPSRFAPGEETCDFSPFAGALRKAGYTGQMSIEGKLNDKSVAGLRKMLETLKLAFQ